MPMYALGIVPLLQRLADCEVSQMWYADDASAGGVSALGRIVWFVQDPSSAIILMLLRLA